MGLEIDYWYIFVEVFLDKQVDFDLVLNMEVVEYVVDVDLFLRKFMQMVWLNGMMIVVIFNCIVKVFVFVIVGVEYVLCWLLCGIY